MTNRICVHCGNEYVPTGKRQDYCKNCRKERVNKHARSYYYRVRRQNFRDRKNKVIIDLGGKCQGCGIEDIRVLEIHHIHGKEYTWDYLRKNGYDIKKLKLLCANCHTLEHYDSKRRIV